MLHAKIPRHERHSRRQGFIDICVFRIAIQSIHHIPFEMGHEVYFIAQFPGILIDRVIGT